MFVVFYSFSNDSYDVGFLLHTIDVKLGIGAVAAVDADGLQSEELLHNITLFAEVNDTIELDVVAAPMYNAMLDESCSAVMMNCSLLRYRQP